ncbi:MAG TPA: hypothetical protein VEL76_06195 [Gemmataceae bacterium]|nr:hypothetical protein [Gemmataceae bacterium]
MTFLSNRLAPWIDPRVKLVKVPDVETYLRRRGWEPVASPRPQMLLFKGPTGDDGEPIVQALPAAEVGSDYTQRIIEVLTNLAVVEDRYAVEILNEILEAGETGDNGVGRTVSPGVPEKQPR